MLRLRDQMTRKSRARYLLWRAGLLGKNATVDLRTGERIVLLKSSLFALSVAYEIFVMDTYRCPQPNVLGSVRRIVDVGANVGYSLIYWGRIYPEACIDAFEPHPDHVEVLRQNLRLNGMEAIVKIHPVAAGTSNKSAYLSDAGAISAIVPGELDGDMEPQTGVIPINIVDFFETMRDVPIDLLKLDCEGAEYELLMDKRFERMSIRNLVMEWHASPARPQADTEIVDRLEALRWKVQPGIVGSAVAEPGLGILRIGVLWAFRER
jgi:FkbM family methyltransferase